MEDTTKLNADYWQERYINKETGWDIGAPSSPLLKYIDQLTNKSLRILIPGCGNSYEATALLKAGFNNVHLLDFALAPLQNFHKSNPTFPEDQLHYMDFFQFEGQFDLILEQTFFCALDPKLRIDYVRKMHSLLLPQGKLAGVLFGIQFEKEGPPFGGTPSEYESIFQPYFDIKKMELCYNSIPQRQGNELFVLMQKRLILQE